jgi:hypothetical protein
VKTIDFQAYINQILALGEKFLKKCHRKLGFQLNICILLELSANPDGFYMAEKRKSNKRDSNQLIKQCQPAIQAFSAFTL